MSEIHDTWSKLSWTSFAKPHMRICLILALAPDVNVLVELGQGESISYIKLHDSSPCVKNALFRNTRGKGETRWATVAVQVTHSDSLERRQ